MALVKKCCCCFNLKYGNLAYGVIVTLSRFCTATMLYFMLPGLLKEALLDFSFVTQSRFQPDLKIGTHSELAVLSYTGTSIGWALASTFVLCIALKGMIDERSILLFPYIVVLIIEVVVFVLISIIAAILISPLYLLVLVVGGSINVYTALCLISLYKEFQQEEKRPPLRHP